MLLTTMARLLYVAIILFSLISSTSADGFGAWLALAPDLDGDGGLLEDE